MVTGGEPTEGTRWSRGSARTSCADRRVVPVHRVDVDRAVGSGGGWRARCVRHRCTGPRDWSGSGRRSGRRAGRSPSGTWGSDEYCDADECGIYTPTCQRGARSSRSPRSDAGSKDGKARRSRSSPLRPRSDGEPLTGGTYPPVSPVVSAGGASCAAACRACSSAARCAARKSLRSGSALRSEDACSPIVESSQSAGSSIAATCRCRSLRVAANQSGAQSASAQRSTPCGRSPRHLRRRLPCTPADPRTPRCSRRRGVRRPGNRSPLACTARVARRDSARCACFSAISR